jgi:hypothetical protein
MSTQLTSQNGTAQLNVRRIIVLAIVVVLVYSLGVVTARGVACVLSAIGHGFQSAAYWLDASIKCSPAEFHSGDALDAYEHRGDPDLYSPAQKSRLNEKQGG